LYQEMARLAMRASISSDIARELSLPGAKLGAVVDELDPVEVLAAELQDHAVAVAEHPDFPDFRYRYGLVLKSAGRIDEALEQFRAAVERNPTYIKALIKLGLTAWEAGRLDEATAALQRAVTLQPEYVDLHYRLGLVYADQGLWPMAVEQYRKALVRQPDAEGVEASLALALENMGLLGEEEGPFAAAPSPGAQTAPGGGSGEGEE
jgi:tetratricopeptide (TPR) repeat protein